VSVGRSRAWVGGRIPSLSWFLALGRGGKDGARSELAMLSIKLLSERGSEEVEELFRLARVER
jgi:hypothetical protein